MKKIVLQLCALFAFLFSASCSNSYLDDCDILGIGGIDKSVFKQPTWKESLNSYISNFSKDLNALNLSLINVKEIPLDSTPNISLIFNDSTLLPVYYGDFNNINLVDFNWFSNDTITWHLKGSYLYSFVDSLLSSNIFYKIVELNWKYGNKYFSTIALFDTYSQELIYDNILFNLCTKKQNYTKTNKTKLSRSEFPYDQGFTYLDEIEFSYNGLLVVSATLSYKEYGEWFPYPIIINHDTIMKRRYLHHYFDYDFSVIRWCLGDFRTYCQFDDRSFYTNSTTELYIEYDIWAGLYGHEPYPGSSMPSTVQYDDPTGVEKHKYAWVGTYRIY